MSDSEKYCPKCVQTKPKTAFYRNVRAIDGCQAYCKECVSQQRRDETLRLRRSEYNRRYRERRLSNPETREVELARSRNWYYVPCNKEKQIASNKRYAATIQGRMVSRAACRRWRARVKQQQQQEEHQP